MPFYANISKRLAALLLASTVVLSGCAGRTPDPIKMYQPNDRQLTCNQIDYQISSNQKEMARLYPQTKKTGKNVALGVAGYFLIVPWFFMDFSDAEKVEITAFQRRDDYLHQLAENKSCGVTLAKIQVEAPPKGQKAA
jgi:hypothetical protein